MPRALSGVARRTMADAEISWTFCRRRDCTSSNQSADAIFEVWRGRRCVSSIIDVILVMEALLNIVLGWRVDQTII